MNDQAWQLRAYRALMLFGVVAAMAVLAFPRHFRATPRTLPALGVWVTDHPADWFALTAITDRALESRVQNPVALWRSAYAAASGASPWREQPRVAFVRSGLFHWMELSESDRQAVLEQLPFLLRDQQTFDRIARPFFELTGDLPYLEKNAPQSLESFEILKTLAASSDRFDDYRRLRLMISNQRLKVFEEQRHSAPQAELLALVPAEIHTEDDTFIRRLLAELHARPLDSEARVGGAVDLVAHYALRHNLRPLDGFDAIIPVAGSASDPVRARLALALGRKQLATSIELTTSTFDQTQWTSYYFERARQERRDGNAQLAGIYETKAASSRTQLVLWRGNCRENEICSRATAEIYRPGASSEGGVTIAPADPAAIPYAEVYFDDALMAEGVIAAPRSIAFGETAGGLHTLEVRIIAPFTADGRQRRLRVERLGL